MGPLLKVDGLSKKTVGLEVNQWLPGSGVYQPWPHCSYRCDGGLAKHLESLEERLQVLAGDQTVLVKGDRCMGTDCLSPMSKTIERSADSDILTIAQLRGLRLLQDFFHLWIDRSIKPDCSVLDTTVRHDLKQVSERISISRLGDDAGGEFQMIRGLICAWLRHQILGGSAKAWPNRNDKLGL